MKTAAIERPTHRLRGAFLPSVCLGLILFCPIPSNAAEPVPVGSEMRVNQVTAGRQLNPAVEALEDGTLVVMWEGEDGDGRGIFGRLLAPAGSISGDEFLVASSTADDQTDVDIAALPGGEFVAVWKSDLYNPVISSRRYDAAGTPSSDVDVFPSQAGVDVFNPRIEASSSEDFVVVWESYDSDISMSAIRGRLLTSGGLPNGGSFEVQGPDGGRVFDASPSARPSGGFALSWGWDGANDRELRARTFDDVGTAEGQQASFIPSQAIDSTLTSLDDDSFMVLWSTTLEGLKRRRGEADGSLGAVVDVSNSKETQRNPAAITLPGQRVAIVWLESLTGEPRHLEVQIIAASGAVECQFTVEETPLTLGPPRLAYDPVRSQLAVVWARRAGPDSDQEEIYLRRFALDVLFADGFESGNTSAWSSP